jgi:hypothetical protein
MTSPVGSRRTQYDFVTNDDPKSATWLLFEVPQRYHFPWSKPKIERCDSAQPHQYAALGFDTTESEGEPLHLSCSMCWRTLWRSADRAGAMMAAKAPTSHPKVSRRHSTACIAAIRDVFGPGMRVVTIGVSFHALRDEHNLLVMQHSL